MAMPATNSANKHASPLQVRYALRTRAFRKMSIDLGAEGDVVASANDYTEPRAHCIVKIGRSRPQGRIRAPQTAPIKPICQRSAAR